jgi:Pyruvate/2-oxoacid:ferredoxin oxidoreductase delta subunit
MLSGINGVASTLLQQSKSGESMRKKDDKLAKFCAVMHIPEFVMPWVDRFFESAEIELVLLLARKPLLDSEVILQMSDWDDALRPAMPQEWLTRAYKRGTINLNNNDRYSPADFHTRFEMWAIFEGWKDIPQHICEQLNRWELLFYENEHCSQIDGLKKGNSPDPARIYPEYILLDEADALLDRAESVYLWPCNCRAMAKRCNNSVYTCLRFDNDRGLGWEISKSRAKEIVRDANAQGLMQSAEVVETQDGTIRGGICNCCADCCYPHQLALRASAQKLWPLSCYVARRLEERCIGCGRCARRCPFQAVNPTKVKNSDLETPQTKNRQKQIVCFNADLCRGCGVCSTGCPAKAIEMIPLT